MKRSATVLFAALSLLLILSGCRRPPSFPAADYPEEMPPPGDYPPAFAAETESGGADVFEYSASYEDTFRPEAVDSWYHLTVDRRLSESEASEIDGYQPGGAFTYYAATVWYDYLRRQPSEQPVFLRQIGSAEQPLLHHAPYIEGESYLMLLRKPENGAVREPLLGENGVFWLFNVTYTVFGGSDTETFAFKNRHSFETLSDLQSSLKLTQPMPEGYHFAQVFRLSDLARRLYEDRDGWFGTAE